MLRWVIFLLFSGRLNVLCLLSLIRNPWGSIPHNHTRLVRTWITALLLRMCACNHPRDSPPRTYACHHKSANPYACTTISFECAHVTIIMIHLLNLQTHMLATTITNFILRMCAYNHHRDFPPSSDVCMLPQICMLATTITNLILRMCVCDHHDSPPRTSQTLPCNHKSAN